MQYLVNSEIQWDIQSTSSLGKTGIYLCQKRRFHVWIVSSEMRSFGGFVSVLLPFLDVMNRVVLIGVDLLEFVEIRANHLQFYLRMLPGARNTLHLSYSQTFFKLQ